MDFIHWLGHASFKLTGQKIIYIDPVKISSKEKADIILVSHSHFDHFSLEDISKITSRETNILITPDSQSKLKNISGKVVLIEPNKKYNVQGILIETFPSYNTNKKFHPRENDWIGFVLNFNGKKILYAGDTDITDELLNVKVDIALVPVSGVYVMNAKEAAELVNKIKPQLAIPYHYGSIVGTEQDALQFKKLANIQVEILEKE
ncbi:MBL fold metallo-hydrolase [Candidatus Woesearchaeota archaeon]|nr:MBL fold metallo-hydrolase [Candidatus Woesearchaeota archaeon]